MHGKSWRSSASSLRIDEGWPIGFVFVGHRPQVGIFRDHAAIEPRLRRWVGSLMSGGSGVHGLGTQPSGADRGSHHVAIGWPLRATERALIRTAHLIRTMVLLIFVRDHALSKSSFCALVEVRPLKGSRVAGLVFRGSRLFPASCFDSGSRGKVIRIPAFGSRICKWILTGPAWRWKVIARRS